MKTAIVTGGGRGIGLGISKILLDSGYNVVLCGVKESNKVNDLVESLNKQYNNRSFYVQCDISNNDQRKNLIDKTIDKFGRIDVLVNNAGVSCETRLDVLEATEESFERLMKINLQGTFFMCQQVANAMINIKQTLPIDYSPRIINIASISSYTSSLNRGEYCISKAGISMVTKLFADRLAEEGITVFEIRPGIILSDMTAAAIDKYQKLIDDSLTPIKRMGQPEDVAKCVLALCSGLMDFGTGTVINADGGFHIRRL